MKTPQEDKIIRTAIYVRVSTDEQAQLGYSIEAQKEKLRAFCKSQDWEIYNTYVDDGYSATNLNRPEIKKLINEAGSKKFNIVVFYRLDRLSRSVKDLNFLIEHFEKNNVAIKSMTEPFDTASPPGKLMFNMLGSFAQFERELIGERTRMGIARRVKEGKWTTTPPFGYNMVNGELVINEKEIAYYKRMLELFLYHNYGAIIIAIKLNEEDKVTRRAGKWSASTVWNMLTNPVYCGLVKWRDNVFKGNHKPIISEKIFKVIQKRLRDRYRVPSEVHASPNFLNRLVVCGKCDSLLTTAKGRKKYHYYACRGRKKECDLNYIRSDELHKAILDEIRELAKTPKIIQDRIAEYNKSKIDSSEKLEKEIEISKRELVELNKKRDRKISWISEQLPDKNITALFTRGINAISAQIEELSRKIERLETEKKQQDEDKFDVNLLKDFLLSFDQNFDGMNIHKKRLLIQCLVKKIVVYSKDKIKVTLALPASPPKDTALATAFELENEPKSAQCYLPHQVWGG